MNKMIFTAVVAVLLVAGCSDKDDAATGTTEPSMLEKAKESTHAAMSDATEMADKAMEDASGMASETASAVGDAASHAMEHASEMADDAKTAISETASDAVEGAGEMVADAKTAVAGMTGAAQKAAGEAESAGEGAEADGEMEFDSVLGQKVYQASCQACHAMGVAGAPKLGDTALWAPRIATGMSALVASVTNGKNLMPPRGACASCSDEDLHAAVGYMISQSK